MITWLGTDHHGKPEVYIHVEVQGQHGANFPERRFTNYRLYDRYRRPVASLAVLADEGENWKPTHFGYQLFGCEVGIRFPTVKILDYADQAEALLADPNPFALVTAAHLFTRQTKSDIKEQYRSASVLKNRRIVFNIKGNDYRLIVAIAYNLQIVYVKFVGTHREYDAVNAETVDMT